jgi:hypothetical protein
MDTALTIDVGNVSTELSTLIKIAAEAEWCKIPQINTQNLRTFNAQFT